MPLTISERIQAAGHSLGILNSIESQRATAKVSEAKAQELEALTREALDNYDSQKSQLEYVRLAFSRTENRVANLGEELSQAEHALIAGFATPHSVSEAAAIIAGLRVQVELAPKAIAYWKSEVTKAEKSFTNAEDKLKKLQ